MKWLGLVLLLAALLGGGGIALLAPDWSGPGLASGADLVTGGGIGIERAGRDVPYGSHGQRLDVYRPTGASAGPRPVLIFFHGGAWRDGSRAAYAFAGRALARMGYVVIVPDYRKLPAERFPAFMDDAAQALAWARANGATYGGDLARIGVIGQSSGAHIALLLALDPRWVAGAQLPRDVIKAAVGISGPYDFYPFDEATLLALMPQLRWLGPVRERTAGFLAATLASLKSP